MLNAPLFVPSRPGFEQFVPESGTAVLHAEQSLANASRFPYGAPHRHGGDSVGLDGAISTGPRRSPKCQRVLFLARQAGVVLGVGGIALLGVACAPEAPPTTTTTTVPGTTTVTSAVSLNCVGVGFAAGTPIAPQTRNISITSPSSVVAGSTFSASVTVAPITVSAPPAGIDLNAVQHPRQDGPHGDQRHGDEQRGVRSPHGLRRSGRHHPGGVHDGHGRCGGQPDPHDGPDRHHHRLDGLHLHADERSAGQDRHGHLIT